MGINVLNQNFQNLHYNLDSFMTNLANSKSGNKNDTGNYYAKKGEPIYQKEMDSDNDGVITMDEFKNYCKENDISAKEMVKMMDLRLKYQMSKNNTESNDGSESTLGDLDIIYAKEGEEKYDKTMDSNNDLRISYKEYLRYCEQNAKTEKDISNTKISQNNKNQFMTISYGKISSAYNKTVSEAPKGKIEGTA